MLASKKDVLVKLAMLTALALTTVALAAFAFGASKSESCPGGDNSAQANAGQRAELVAAAKAGAKAEGSNFGAVQSGYNHTACGHGSPGE